MEILIVEDDQTTAQQLVKLLKSEKYGCDLAGGYKQAAALLDHNSYSLILLDWNLGDGDGLTLLKELRGMGVRTPIMMLSANSQIDERVVVLDAGADDYLCKPYSSVELLARIRALLRRESQEKSSSIEIEGVKLDTTTREVSVGGLAIELTASEFDILELFMQNQTAYSRVFN